MNTIKFIVIVSMVLLGTDLIYQKKNPELIKGNIKLKWLDIIKISVKGTIAKNAIKKD